jgi:hypothetical protein
MAPAADIPPYEAMSEKCQEQLSRCSDHNIQRLDQLLPWNWEAPPAELAA